MSERAGSKYAYERRTLGEEPRILTSPTSLLLLLLLLLLVIFFLIVIILLIFLGLNFLAPRLRAMHRGQETAVAKVSRIRMRITIKKRIKSKDVGSGGNACQWQGVETLPQLGLGSRRSRELIRWAFEGSGHSFTLLGQTVGDVI